LNPKSAGKQQASECPFASRDRERARVPRSHLLPLGTAMDHFAQVATLANEEIAQEEYQAQDDGRLSGKKRKNEDGQPQQRSKRNRYISIACNEVRYTIIA
jgi:hypothetical protein